ncbi:MAG: GNAT family N-acetyltransferase [Clostridiaceae bacterium]
MNNLVRLSMKDFNQFLELKALCFPNDESEREIWLDLFEDEKSLIFAIKEHSVLIAYIAIYNWKGEKDYIKLMSIGTHPGYRCQGLSHSLMQYVIDEMRKDGMHQFKGETRESNINMQKLFQDFDYKLSHQIEAGYIDPIETAYKYSLEF